MSAVLLERTHVKGSGVDDSLVAVVSNAITISAHHEVLDAAQLLVHSIDTVIHTVAFKALGNTKTWNKIFRKTEGYIKLNIPSKQEISPSAQQFESP